MPEGFVYRWTNRVDGKWYVGSHMGAVDDGYIGSGIIFRHAVLKYGLENFDREILYIGENFHEEEERLLKELDAAHCDLSYNMKNESLGVSLPGEKNGMFGKKHTEEAKEMMSKTLSEGERWGNPAKRIDHSLKMTGESNPMFGIDRKGSWSSQKTSVTKRLKQEEWEFIGGVKRHRTAFTNIFRRLVVDGHLVSPRGQLVIEVENFSYRLPPFVRFCNFEHRKLNIPYIKHEFLWYLKGDKFDKSILEKANMWKNLVNEDGSINSNYGQYVFGDQKQFDDVIRTLCSDRDSRRASIVILANKHLKMKTPDVPCTYSLNFRIREGRLNMSVHMRSQDAVFGMGNDAPTFSFIHEMMLNALRRTYPDLQYGEYFHIADSFHVYERHFGMLHKLTGYEKEDDGFTRRENARLSSYKSVLCPKMSGPDEVDLLRSGAFSNVPENFKFTRWLLSENTMGGNE